MKKRVTLLIVTTTEEVTEYYIRYFETHQQAEAHAATCQGIDCKVTTAIFDRYLTSEEAIAEWLD